LRVRQLEQSQIKFSSVVPSIFFDIIIRIFFSKGNKKWNREHCYFATRLGQLNKEFNSSVNVSKYVINNVKAEGAEFIFLVDVNVKGFANAVEVHKLL